MFTQKPKIDPRVRAKLEELGVEVVRSKLVWIMNVSTLGEQDKSEPLGDGVSTSRRQMQDWLKQKSARESLWVRVGVIAAVLAAVFSFLGLRFPFD
jgi:hypothetical protein